MLLLRGLSREAPPDQSHPPLTDAELTMTGGEWAHIVAPAVSGKSTLLEMIAGVLLPASGTIELGGRLVGGPGDDRGLMAWQPHLFSWMTGVRNVAFASRSTDPALAPDHLLELLGIDRAADRLPATMSPRERWGVALARALADAPKLLLLDDPWRREGASPDDLWLAAIEDARRRGTMVLSAGRAPIAQADRTLALDGGRLRSRKLASARPG